MSERTTLILTVGTGRPDDLDKTLYAPMLKSIGDGDWNEITLLPSVETKKYAEELKRRLQSLLVNILPLPQVGDENDVDACFAHFDSVIQKLRLENFDPAQICVDFTRGTKAMSAALALAAVRHDIPRMRYVEGDRDPSAQNNVIAETERIRTVATAIATASRRLDQARDFIEHGLFAAVLGLLPSRQVAIEGGWPPMLESALESGRSFGAFFSAWDRLDYSTACSLSSTLATPPPEWVRFAPTQAELEWVSRLAVDSPKRYGVPLCSERSAEMGTHARRLMVDLLANGRRRISHSQFEDANLRAYRIAEMLGQTHLFDRGLDSSFLDPDNPDVASFQTDLRKKHSHPLVEKTYQRRRYLQAAREQTARLLSRLDDPISKELSNTSSDVESRNNSILIHGFDRLDSLSATKLRSTFDKIEDLLRADLGSAAEQWFRIAHFQDRLFRK